MNFNDEYKKRLTLINEHIESFFANECKNLESFVTEAPVYSVLNGGKRVRGILTLEIARMLGGNEKTALEFAAAIEFIQAYSLVHDDLPCMDDDDYRRGQLSCHKKFGEAKGVLCGDSLLNLAYEVMLKSILNGGDGEKKAAAEIAHRAGIFGMIKGQLIDIDLMSKKDITLSDVEKLIEYKTTALISAAALAGAHIANADGEDIENIKNYAYHLGTAFQIRDDFEDEEEDKLREDEEKTPNFINLLGKEKATEKLVYHRNSARDILKKYEKSEFLTAMNEFLFGAF